MRNYCNSSLYFTLEHELANSSQNFLTGTSQNNIANGHNILGSQIAKESDYAKCEVGVNER